MNAQFDIAISYASQDAWLAHDLHDLLIPYGLSVYCYTRMPDESKGFLRERLVDIYSTSCVNILIWSQSYSTAASDSFPAMERRFIVHRHVNKGESHSFLPIRIDQTPLDRPLEITLAHQLQDFGVLGLERIVVERLRELRMRPTDDGIVFHPPPTDKYRGELRPCHFQLNPQFRSDPLKRWQQLGDIWTKFPNDKGTKHVYLIPSGLCTVYLRHTVRFRTQPDYLEAKRIASAKWAKIVGDRNSSGFWFLSTSSKAPEREVVILYCAEYDRYLNEHFEQCLNEVRKKIG